MCLQRFSTKCLEKQFCYTKKFANLHLIFAAPTKTAWQEMLRGWGSRIHTAFRHNFLFWAIWASGRRLKSTLKRIFSLHIEGKKSPKILFFVKKVQKTIWFEHIRLGYHIFVLFYFLRIKSLWMFTFFNMFSAQAVLIRVKKLRRKIFPNWLNIIKCI